jgi:hypothetical protein
VRLDERQVVAEGTHESFERVAGEPDGPSPEVVAMVRRLDQDITEARRALQRTSATSQTLLR